MPTKITLIQIHHHPSQSETRSCRGPIDTWSRWVLSHSSGQWYPCQVFVMIADCLAGRDKKVYFVCSICENDVQKLPKTLLILVHEKMSNVSSPAPTMHKFIGKAMKWRVFQKVATSFGIPGKQYSVNIPGFSICPASIDGALHNVVPKWLKVYVLHPSPFPAFSGHHKQNLMYDTLHCDYSWSLMSKDIYDLVASCMECHKKREHYWHQRNLKLFPARVHPQFFEIRILGPLSKTSNRNQFIIFLTDIYSNLARACLNGKQQPHMLHWH